MALVSQAKRLVPRPLWDRATRRLLYAGTDWAGTRAFCLPNDFSGAIRINLIGREPAGTVAPGADYAAVLQLLEDSLRELVQISTGEPVVRDVLRYDPAADGTRMGSARPGRPVGRRLSGRSRPLASLGEIRCRSPELRTGGHRNEGMLIAAGPQIRARGVVAAGHIVDLAPTIAALSGLEPAGDLDGRVLSYLFRP